MPKGSITFDLIVGQSYPIHYKGRSASLSFIGMISDGRNKILLFHNPLNLGVPYDYIGAIPRIIWPEVSSSVVTIEFHLSARYVGQTLTALTLLTDSQSQIWGSGTP